MKIPVVLTGLLLEDVQDLLEAIDAAIESRKPSEQTERWVKARHEITKAAKALKKHTIGEKPRNDEVEPARTAVCGPGATL